MKTTNITETILHLTEAIDCLDTAQLQPMLVEHRIAIGDEIQRIFGLIADISESHSGGKRNERSRPLL